MPDRKPAWWSGLDPHPAEILATSPRQPQHHGRTATSQGSLFSGQEARGTEASQASWIDHLLSSPIFIAQRRMVGRRSLDNGTVEALLRVLEQHHDRLSQQAMAQALGQPKFRIRELLVALQRLLNVEGYQVVAIDDATGTTILNRPLLAEQFQLPSSLQ